MIVPLLLAVFAARPVAPKLAPDQPRENPHLEFPTHNAQILPEDARNYRIRAVSVGRILVEIRPFPISEILPEKVEGDDATADPGRMCRCLGACQRPGPARFRRWFSRPVDSGTSWTLHLDLDSVAKALHGQFLEIGLKCPPSGFLPRVDTTWCDTLRHREDLLVSRMGILATRLDSHRVHVAVFDLETGAPWPRAEVVALTRSGRRLHRVRTDSSGWTVLAMDSATRLRAEAGANQAWVHLPIGGWSDWKPGIRMEDILPNRNGLDQEYRLFPYLGHQVHRPGDTLVAGCLVRQGQTVPVGSRVRVSYGRGCLGYHAETTLVVPADGHLQWRTPLPRPERYSTCWTHVDWRTGDARSSELLAIELPWRARPDTSNPGPEKGFSCDPKDPNDWVADTGRARDSLFEGDTLRMAMDAPVEGISLVQVIQGHRVLWQEWVRLHRGANLWKHAVDSTWNPGVEVGWRMTGLHRPGDTATWTRSLSKSLAVRAIESRFGVSIAESRVDTETGTTVLRIRNSWHRRGTVSVSVVDTATGSLDLPETKRLEAYLHRPVATTAWYGDGLGEVSRCHPCEIGSPCDLDQAREPGTCGACCCLGYGTGSGSAACGYMRVPSIQILSERPIARPFAWSSTLLDLPLEGLEIRIPTGSFHGALRARVAASSGRLAGMSETVIP